MKTIKRNGRCVCGILVSHHYNQFNRKISCEDARRLHPRASKRSAAVRQMFMKIVPKDTDNGKA